MPDFRLRRASAEELKFCCPIKAISDFPKKRLTATPNQWQLC
jgi:hypothetical protein